VPGRAGGLAGGSPLRPLPGLALERAAQCCRAIAEHGASVCDKNVLDVKGGQGLKRRQVTLAPPAAAAFAVQRVVPHAQLPAACLDDGVTEDQGPVGGDLDRLLGAGRAANRMKRATPPTSVPPVTASNPEASPSRVATSGCP